MINSRMETSDYLNIANNLESVDGKETIKTNKQTLNSESWIIENSRGTISPLLTSSAGELQIQTSNSSTADVFNPSTSPSSSMILGRKLEKEKINFTYVEPTAEQIESVD